MPVIPSELWVRAFKGRVAMGFRLLDTVQGTSISTRGFLAICLAMRAK